MAIFTALYCCYSSIAFHHLKLVCGMSDTCTKIALIFYLHNFLSRIYSVPVVWMENGVLPCEVPKWVLKFIQSHECRWNHLISCSENSIWSYLFGRTFCGNLFSKWHKKVTQRKIPCFTCPTNCTLPVSISHSAGQRRRKKRAQDDEVSSLLCVDAFVSDGFRWKGCLHFEM